MPNLILHAAGAATLTGRHPSTGHDLVLPAGNIRIGQEFQTKSMIDGREVIAIAFADVRRQPADPRTMIQCKTRDGEIFSHVVCDDLIVALRGDIFKLAQQLDIVIPRRDRRTA